MSRRLSRPSPAVLLIVGYLLVAAATFHHYGISWDEPLQAEYGERVLRYFASGFEDRSYENLLNLAYYGPVFEVLPPLAYRHAPQWKYEIRHAFIALAAALALLGVARIARHLSDDPRLAFFSVLILILMPAWYGHSFMNSKDIPFAALFTWSMAAVLRLFEQPRWHNALLLGLIGGLTLGVRVGGVLLYAIAGAALLLYALIRSRERPRCRQMVVPLILSGVVAWLVMTAVWPWAHRHPIGNPLEALHGTSNIPLAIEVLFEGRFWPAGELPARFTAEMFAVTTPLPILPLITLGLAALLRRETSYPRLLILVWVVAPPLLHLVMGASRYDATRHFLFVYPALALLGGAGALAIVRAVDRTWATAGVVAAIASVIPVMVLLHPYQYAYFNEAAGSVAGGAARYDSEYWSTAYREAALWVRNHRCGGQTNVLVANDRITAPTVTHFLPDDVKTTSELKRGQRGPLPEPFHYYVGRRRQEMHQNYAATPVAYRVERLGATFAVVRGGCR